MTDEALRMSWDPLDLPGRMRSWAPAVTDARSPEQALPCKDSRKEARSLGQLYAV